MGLLDFSILLRGLGELGTIKKHLFKASREVLLATQSLLSVADGYVGQSNADRGQAMATVLGFAQKTISRITEMLPHEDEDQFHELQGKVFGTILSVIDHEIEETGNLKNPKAKMRQDVLAAIRTVLIKEMKKSEAQL